MARCEAQCNTTSQALPHPLCSAREEQTLHLALRGMVHLKPSYLPYKSKLSKVIWSAGP